MRIVEDKPCDSCGTMLHKISFIDLSTDERRFDYLDSPNHEEHTRDRCRWAQAESKLAAERERRQREGDEADDLWQSKLYAALAAQKQAEERAAGLEMRVRAMAELPCTNEREFWDAADVRAPRHGAAGAAVPRHVTFQRGDGARRRAAHRRPVCAGATVAGLTQSGNERRTRCIASAFFAPLCAAR